MDKIEIQCKIAECLDNLALIINTADPKDVYDYYALLEKAQLDINNCYAMMKEIDFGN